ncbi:unnamed protein product [Porites evermanni]|uniref:Uncharacterized protein n=1 Tax=Porites evermanni TaxID=104178 RepID=A0ABN8SU51_9CNID|nr:unnamed protein product [Porites evermanni]
MSDLVSSTENQATEDRANMTVNTSVKQRGVTPVAMKSAVIFCCVLALVSVANSLKHKTGHGGRKSVVVVNPVQRSAWECHPGCRRFCLSSCKRSCCAPGAPNYTPDMFPQLVSYQASLPPPPPPPPACPTGCPSTCYPSCDAGCCFPVNQAPVYPQYSANPYSTGYGGYPTDPCAAQGCSAECAPLCKPDCCRSQALNLSIRPVYLGSKASPATSTSPKKVAAEKKPPPPKKKPAVDLKKLAGKTNFLCVRPCQKLCKPICKFECCLPTYKFHDSHPAPKKPAKDHHVKPVASPQRVPVPKLASPPEPTEGPAAQDLQPPSPYAGGYQNPDPAAAMMASPPEPTCPGACPMSCAPSCDFSCCSSYMTPQPQPVAPVPPQQGFPYGAVPPNPMVSNTNYMVSNTNPIVRNIISMVINTKPMVSNTNPMASNTNPMVINTKPMVSNNNPMASNTNPMVININPMASNINPTAPNPVPQAPPSPGLAPLSCPGQSCPDSCAPLCSPSCCAGISRMLPANWDKRNNVPRAA